MYLRGCSGSPGVVWCGCVRLKSRRVEGGGSHCGTSEVAGGGGCVKLKSRRVEGGGSQCGTSEVAGIGSCEMVKFRRVEGGVKVQIGGKCRMCISLFRVVD